MTLARRTICLFALLFTIPLGIAWRGLPLHLSPFLFKYGGSALWAIALYWLVAALLPQRSSRTIAAIAAATAALLEFSRLWHVPAIDAFRLTLAGRLLLGRFFSLKNIAGYWLAVAAIAWLDERLRRRD
jgi:hypothetical protein